MYAYAFIFYRGVARSNMPYKELVALIRKHSSSPIWRINEIIDIRKENPGDGWLGVRCFHNSMLVYSVCELDLELIISDSGYIQSCGELIFESPWYDLDAHQFTKELLAFASCSSKKYVFYTMEDFGLNTPSKEGVDDIKFYRDKQYIGEELASNFISRFSDKVIEDNNIVDRWNSQSNDVKGDDHMLSLFVIKDSVVDDRAIYEIGHTTNQHHVIAYHSEFKKENPVHILDDWRPFWPGQYTTPAPLSTSALNLAKVDADALLIDPFAGSGGIGVAGASLGIKCAVSDLCGAPGIQFNFDYLKDANFRDRIISQLHAVADKLTQSHYKTVEMILNLAAIIRDAIPSMRVHWCSRLDEIINELESHEKICAFLIYRVFYYNQKLLKVPLHSKTLIESLIATTELFIQNSNRAFLVDGKPPHPSNGSLKIGKYGILTARTQVPWGDVLITKLSADQLNSDSKLVELAKGASQIIYATDLPYGVNTNIDEEEGHLKDLYINSFKAAFELTRYTRTKKISVILFALQSVKIGKRVPQSAFSNDVRLALSEVANKLSCISIKHPNADNIPVYVKSNGYWRSEKALDREIIFHEYFLGR